MWLEGKGKTTFSDMERITVLLDDCCSGWEPELIHRNSSEFEGSYSRGKYFVIACKKV
jgi:hypothetical protein